MYIMLNNVGIAIGVCFWGCNYTILCVIEGDLIEFEP